MPKCVQNNNGFQKQLIMSALVHNILCFVTLFTHSAQKGSFSSLRKVERDCWKCSVGENLGAVRKADMTDCCVLTYVLSVLSVSHISSIAVAAVSVDASWWCWLE